MKNLLTFCMVIALLVMNIAGVAHADCADGMCDGIQIVKSEDTGNQDGNTGKAECDYCLNCSHHHSHAALNQVKAEHFATTSQVHHSWGGATYFSQLHYPPSKPPKA